MKKFSSLKKVFSTFLVAFALMISSFLTACGPKATKYAITWDVPTHSSVTVEGYETLPTEVEENTTLIFTVSVDNGYEILNVKAYSKTIKPTDGKYSVTVTAETKISVSVERQVTGIEVTSNPTKLKYYAGDSLDTTGMVVVVNYATGESEPIEKGVDGYAVSPSIFEGGEESFKVIFGDYEKVVNLASRVEYLVTIDPNGGRFESSWLDSVAALNLNEYAVSDSGVISFTYFNNLTNDITIPNPTRENYVFMGWGDAATTITNTTGNVSAIANWQAELVVVESAALVVESGVPYLVVTGTYKLADSVYLFLYEGNDDVSLVGDTYTNNAGVGAAFECKFDLRKLVNAEAQNGGTFEGKWMDIRFNAVIGEREESMEINVGPDSTVSVDLAQVIEAEDCAFTFATYDNKLKVYYNVVHYTYEVSFAQREITKVVNDAEQKVTVDALVISGTAPLYKGNKIEVSWWNGSIETTPSVSDIDSNGNFEIVIDLTDRELIPLDSNAFAHVHIYSADGTTLFGDTSTNLKVINCKTEFPQITQGTAGADITNAIRYETADGIAIYAGYAWDGLMLYAKDENKSLSYTNATIANVDGKAIITVTGTYSGWTDEEIEAANYVDLQKNPYRVTGSWDGDWARYYPTGTVEAADGQFTLSFDVTDLEAYSYTMHGCVGATYEPETGPDLKVSATIGAETEGSSVEISGRKYQLISVPGSGDGAEFWGCLGLDITAA